MNDKTDIEENKKNKLYTIIKILIIIFSIIIIGLIVGIIILSVQKKANDKEEKNSQDKKDIKLPEEVQLSDQLAGKAGYLEPWYDLYGNKTINISYAQNDLIPNSFKEGGENYKDEIGNVNEGKDYHKNERNVYDLYIPYSSLKRKNNHNGIILMIHGGSWIEGKKEDVESFASRYAKQGYITATIGYTVLSDPYTEYNIFRILDEITACLKSIKEELNIQGFDVSKLELAIGGVSAGSHISLLYGYTYKNDIIPLKFLINVVGPISLEPQYWYKPAVNNDTLESIEDCSVIENAKQNNKLAKIFDNEFVWAYLMNLFIGKKYSEFEILGMISNGEINTNNQKYKDMLKIAENAFPIKLVSNNPIPLLCEYCGNDSLVGIAQYCHLKEIYNQLSKEIDFVYMRYSGHEVYHYDTEQGITAMKEMNYKILHFAKSHFTSD